VSDTTVNADSSVYYQAGYWNELAQVRDHLNARSTGDPAVAWSEHLANWRGRPFAKALILNCGNGWVERDLVTQGLVKEAVGVDFIDDLLDAARAEARKQGLALRYYQMDTNTADFPEDGYDLVVNFAAGHHIARLDKVFRQITEMLPDDGVFVSWDYVGSHRNQYSTAMWETAWQTNKTLPEDLRQVLAYPHLPTMLATDPTEAIHSELILQTMRRYFSVAYFRAIGGAIGYPLLTFNKAIHARDPEQVSDVVATILKADAAFTDLDPEANALFAYLISTPNKAALADAAQLAEWTREEDEREATATSNGGVYYPPTMVGELFEQLTAARDELTAGAAGLRPPTIKENDRQHAGDRSGRRMRLRTNPALRAGAARIPGARPVYRQLRKLYHRVRG
jgi:SAM-dependent methyltransferase